MPLPQKSSGIHSQFLLPRGFIGINEIRAVTDRANSRKRVSCCYCSRISIRTTSEFSLTRLKMISRPSGETSKSLITNSRLEFVS